MACNARGHRLACKPYAAEFSKMPARFWGASAFHRTLS